MTARGSYSHEAEKERAGIRSTETSLKITALSADRRHPRRPWGVSKRENKEKVATSPPVRVREGREGENPRGGEGKTILNAESSRAIRVRRGKGLRPQS